MSAIISPCGRYRYALWRSIPENDAPRRARLYVMLNPSTADADTDDPTIRRCVGFARRDGFGTVIVANLFGIRETESKRLGAHADPVGPDNDRWLRDLSEGDVQIVVAWGARAKLPKAWAHREREVLGMFYGPVHCLGTTKDGSPSHPLYLPGDARILPYGAR
jgi:hypothetical protein